MPNYSEFQITTLFDQLWERWPNKVAEASAKKAFTVALRSDIKAQDIIKAADLYLLDNIGTDPDYVYRLGNFIREDHWKDALENVSEVKLRKAKAEAEMLIQSWNESCCKHWCPIADMEARLPTAMKALNDKSFHKHWKEALKKATLIFKYEFREDNPFSKIKLSFRWFTDTHHDKHTVLRIVEGHYGEAVKEAAEKPVVFFEKDPVRMKEAAEEIRLFRLGNFEQSSEQIREESIRKGVEPVIVTDAAIALVEEMKRQLGRKNYVREASETEELAASVLKGIRTENESDSQDDDPYAFVPGDGS